MDEPSESPSRIRVRLDHVSVAVPSSRAALPRWQRLLGAGFAGGTQRDGFITSQWRYRNGAKLKLIEPDPDHGVDPYLSGFLAKYGARIHHITLKIPDLEQAVAALRRAGIEPININMENPLFHEAFLRPRDVGGLLIQLLWTEVADYEWENNLGLAVTAPPDDGAELAAVRLRYPDQEDAASLWITLGATVSHEHPGLVARWPDSSLTVQIELGAPAGPVFLVFSDAPSLPAHPRIGPAVQSTG